MKKIAFFFDFIEYHLKQKKLAQKSKAADNNFRGIPRCFHGRRQKTLLALRAVVELSLAAAAAKSKQAHKHTPELVAIQRVQEEVEHKVEIVEIIGDQADQFLTRAHLVGDVCGAIGGHVHINVLVGAAAAAAAAAYIVTSGGGDHGRFDIVFH